MHRHDLFAIRQASANAKQRVGPVFMGINASSLLPLAHLDTFVRFDARH